MKLLQIIRHWGTIFTDDHTEGDASVEMLVHFDFIFQKIPNSFSNSKFCRLWRSMNLEEGEY